MKLSSFKDLDAFLHVSATYRYVACPVYLFVWTFGASLLEIHLICPRINQIRAAVQWLTRTDRQTLVIKKCTSAFSQGFSHTNTSGYDSHVSSSGVDINECLQPGFCENGNCVNTRGSYSCVCKEGYLLDASHGICICKYGAVGHHGVT